MTTKSVGAAANYVRYREREFTILPSETCFQNIPNQPHRADRDRIEKCIGFGARSVRLSGKSVSSPVEKNFSFGFELKSLLSRALSCLEEGRTRRHGRWVRDAMDAAVSEDERC